METAEEIMATEDYMEIELRRYPNIYNAIRSDDWRQLIVFMENSMESMEIIINMSFHQKIFSDLLINVLIAYEKIDLALDAIQFMDPRMLMMKNLNGDTALHMAAVNGDMSVTKALLNKNSRVISVRNLQGETPLFKAALNGEREIFWELNHGGGQIKDRRFDGATVLHCALMTNNFGLALEIAEVYPDLIDLRDQLGMTAFHHLVSNRKAFRSGYDFGLLDSFLYRCITVRKGLDPIPKRDEENVMPETVSPMVSEQGMDPSGSAQVGHLHSDIADKSKFSFLESGEEILDLGKGKSNVIKKIFKPLVQLIRRNVHKILRLTAFKKKLIKLKMSHWCVIKLLSHIASRQEYWWSLTGGISPKGDSASDHKYDKSVERWMETPLTLGTRMGLDELVLRILMVYPRAAEQQGKEGKNVLHVAVETRRDRIVNAMTKGGSEMDRRLHSRLLSAKDDDGNTILHLAAVVVHDTSSPLQMQEEFKWFEKVKQLIPRELVNHRNKDGKTAQEVFTDSHMNMLKDAKRQLTDTARSSCAALISAVTFAASFSMDSSKEKKSTNGNHNDMKAFKIFSHAYNIGLSCATIALLQFMALLKSSYKEDDFRHSLPAQYNLAQCLLLLAMLAMFVAFGCNTYVTLYGAMEPDWKKYLPYAGELFIIPILCVIILRCQGVKIGFVSKFRAFFH